jgi:hypothetical protein
MCGFFCYLSVLFLIPLQPFLHLLVFSNPCPAFSATCPAQDHTCSLFCNFFQFAQDLEARPLFSAPVQCPARRSNVEPLQPCLIRQAVRYCTFAALSDICPARLLNIVPLQPFLTSVHPGCQILCDTFAALSDICPPKLSNIVPLQACLIPVTAQRLQPFCMHYFVQFFTLRFCTLPDGEACIGYLLALADTSHGLSRSL